VAPLLPNFGSSAPHVVLLEPLGGPRARY
jgi:hypothetical protein